MPLALTERETSAVAEIIIQLDESFVDAVALIERTSATLNQDRPLIHRLDTQKAARYREAAARLVVHLLRGTKSDKFYDHGGLKRIFDAVRAHISRDLANRFKEAAANVGTP